MLTLYIVVEQFISLKTFVHSIFFTETLKPFVKLYTEEILSIFEMEENLLFVPNIYGHYMRQLKTVNQSCSYSPVDMGQNDVISMLCDVSTSR